MKRSHARTCIVAVVVGLGIPTPGSGQSPTISTVSERSVRLVSGGSEVRLLLEGNGLETFTDVELRVDGRPLEYVSGRLAQVDRGTWAITLVARAGADAAEGTLVLVGSSDTLDVPDLAVVVEVPFVPARVTVSPQLTMVGRRFTPAHVRVSPGMTMVGLRFSMELVTVEPRLTMVGLRFVPARIHVQPPLTMIGLGR